MDCLQVLVTSTLVLLSTMTSALRVDNVSWEEIEAAHEKANLLLGEERTAPDLRDERVAAFRHAATLVARYTIAVDLPEDSVERLQLNYRFGVYVFWTGDEAAWKVFEECARHPKIQHPDAITWTGKPIAEALEGWLDEDGRQDERRNPSTRRTSGTRFVLRERVEGMFLMRPDWVDSPSWSLTALSDQGQDPISRRSPSWLLKATARRYGHGQEEEAAESARHFLESNLDLDETGILFPSRLETAMAEGLVVIGVGGDAQPLCDRLDEDRRNWMTEYFDDLERPPVLVVYANLQSPLPPVLASYSNPPHLEERWNDYHRTVAAFRKAYGLDLDVDAFYEPADNAIVLAENVSLAAFQVQDLAARELARALMSLDFPDAPPWLVEGFVAFQERGGDTYFGDDYRLWYLADAEELPIGLTVRFEDLFDPAAEAWFDDRLPIMRAMAQYFCLFLHERNPDGDLLRKVYHSLRDDDIPPGESPDSRRLVETATGRSLPELETEFRTFLSHRPMWEKSMWGYEGPQGTLSVPRYHVSGLLQRWTGDETLATLARLGRPIENLDLRGSSVTNDGLPALAGVEGLRALDLRNTEVNNTGLVHLSRLSSLETLLLSDHGYSSTIDAGGLPHLAGLAHLRQLVIDLSNARDEDLVHLSGLIRLEALNLSEAAITDAGLAHLTGLEGLRELDLHETTVTDVGLGHLQELPNLRNLDLHDTDVSLSGTVRFFEGRSDRPLFDALETVAALETDDSGAILSVSFSNSYNDPFLRLSDADLARLANLTHLERLDLSGTEVTDTGLEHLAGLTRLEHLDLEQTAVTNEGLAHLTAMTGLENVNLEGTRVTDSGMLQLVQSVPSVRWLGVRDTAATASGLRRLKAQRPELQISYDPLLVVDLEQLTQVGASGTLNDTFELIELRVRSAEFTDDDLMLLADRDSLRELDLDSAPISDAGLVHLADLTALRFLRMGSDAVTNQGLTHLSGLDALEELVIRNAAVTDSGLTPLVKDLPALKRLDVQGTAVTGDGLRQIVEVQPDIELSYDPLTVVGLEEFKRIGGFGQLDDNFELVELHLSFTEATDDTLSHLTGRDSLRILDLSSTSVTDSGLAKLIGLENLRKLDLGSTEVTDAGLEHLLRLENLRELDLSLTGVTRAGVKRFLQARPECEVKY